MTLAANLATIPTQGLMFRNRLINGEMIFAQRQTSATFGAGASYVLDRWYTSASIANVLNVAQVSDAPVGFQTSLRATSLASYTPGTSQGFLIGQGIEALNCADLMWGTANAKPVVLSFWVKASATGTYSGSARNGGTPSYIGYPFTYTINAVNTWEYKIISIPGATTGGWGSSTNSGIWVFFDLGCGTSLRGSAGSWQAGNVLGVTGTATPMASNGATWSVTGVQLEEGYVATEFERRLIGTELLLCQRYYATSFGNPEYHQVPAPGATYATFYRVDLPATMRIAPTFSPNYSASNAVLSYTYYPYNTHVMHYVSASVATNAYMYFTWQANADY